MDVCYHKSDEPNERYLISRADVIIVDVQSI